MTVHIDVADWVAIVFGSASSLTVADLGAMRTDVAVAALSVTRATVAGSDLYPDDHMKAAALLSELLIRAPLSIDVFNREIAAVTTLMFLDQNGHAWRPSPTHLPYWISETCRGRLGVHSLAQAIADECVCP
ncbi:MAG: hypothetical protein QOJ79_1035 [Actinomycetota bacterium]|jgi:hypothetical protein|nr:hypothetical protein [Actinomycetota bacterium]